MMQLSSLAVLVSRQISEKLLCEIIRKRKLLGESVMFTVRKINLWEYSLCHRRIYRALSKASFLPDEVATGRFRLDNQ